MWKPKYLYLEEHITYIFFQIHIFKHFNNFIGIICHLEIYKIYTSLSNFE
jgi:hypothetical protein